MKYIVIIGFMFSFASRGFAQEDEKIVNSILLDSVVIIADNDFNVNKFVNRVREDSSFYQAFKNLRYYPHKANGKIWAYNKKNKEKAFEELVVDQHLKKGQMWQTQDVLKSEGKIKNRKGECKFTTAQMYYDVFFPTDTLPVSTQFTSVKNEKVANSKKAKYKHDVKVMMFNPGEDVSDVPIVGKKMSIFDDDMVEFYEYRINSGKFNGRECYIFNCLARPEFKANKTVIKSLITYFDKESMNVIKRESHMKYRSLFFHFNVKILVENEVVNGVLVPKTIKFNGYWDVPFKVQETLKFKVENWGY